MSELKPDLTVGIPSDSLKHDTPVLGTVDGQDVILIRHAGGLSALSAKCTHAGASLDEGLVVNAEIRCPWHHARFALDTGRATSGPAIEPLSCYEVQEGEGTVKVLPRTVSGSGPDQSSRIPNERIVIIGAGAAGYALADSLARAGLGAQVTLLSRETEPPYDRTLCSKEYLSGEISRDECFLPEPGAGARDGILAKVDLRLGTEVTSIDPLGKIVRTDGGGILPYEHLVLATGSDPVVPGFKGSDHSAVHLLRSLADADRLIEAAGRASSVAILGAGFIGLEVAASLRARGLPVTVIAQEEVPLARVLGEEAGRFIRGLHEKQGVEFIMGSSVESFDGATVLTDSGETVQADLLVAGVGARPRIEIASAAGLALTPDGAAVAVDARLRTSDPAIYAIGDIASYPDPLTGEALRVEHWVHAERQGQHLARMFTKGHESPYRTAPFFWSRHYGTNLSYVGHATGSDPREVSGTIDRGDFEIRYRHDPEFAVLTCDRDKAALEAEAEWEARAAD